MLSFETLLKTRCSLQAHKLALLLSNDKHDSDAPILEAAVSHLTLGVAAQGQALPQQLSGQCDLTLQLDVYNNALMGWEPLLEPWAASVTVVAPVKRYEDMSMYAVLAAAMYIVAPIMSATGRRLSRRAWWSHSALGTARSPCRASGGKVTAGHQQCRC